MINRIQRTSVTTIDPTETRQAQTDTEHCLDKYLYSNITEKDCGLGDSYSGKRGKHANVYGYRISISG